jgi:CheY-like chemotaxis protein
MQKNLLLVDDESSLRRSLYLGLSQEGYSIEPCENGVNAIKKLHLYKQNNVNLDAIILDIKLPDIDGVKLAKIIKQQYPEAKIIFMTGYSDDIDKEDIKSITVSKILEKPFPVDELVRQIVEISDKSIDSVLEVEAKKKAEKEPLTKTYSAYALLKIDEKADFFAIYRQLYFDNNTLYCDATKGDHDIFLLVQSRTQKGCREVCDNFVKNIEGITDMEYLEIANPILDESLKGILNQYSIESADQSREIHNAVCSYLLVEIEKEKLEYIYPALYFGDNVVYCDYTDSKYNLILLVHGTQFSEINNFIKNKVVNLDGVLKVKEYPIIPIYEM